MSDIYDNMRHAIKILFKHMSPSSLRWTESTRDIAKSLSPEPQLVLREPSPELVLTITDVIKRVLPDTTVEFYNPEYMTERHCWSIIASDHLIQISYIVLLCNFYPIITLRACTGPSPFSSLEELKGLDKHWHLKLSNKKDVDYVNKVVQHLGGEINLLTSKYKYQYLRQNGSASDAKRIGLWSTV